MTFGGPLSGLEDWLSIVHEAELPEQSGQAVPDIDSSPPGRTFMHRRARGNVLNCRIQGDLRTGGGHGCGQWGTAAARANGGSGRARRRAGRAVPGPAGWCGGGAGVARDCGSICGRSWSRSSGRRATADRLATIGKSSSMLAAGHVEADQQHVAPPSRPSGTDQSFRPSGGQQQSAADHRDDLQPGTSGASAAVASAAGGSALLIVITSTAI
jgi:hypothetical protein